MLPVINQATGKTVKMLILYFAIFLVVDAKCAVVTPKKATIDYYWREYDGIVPYDAIPGGFDKAGEEIYIGQAFIKDHGVIPSTIIGTDKKVITVAAGKVFNPTENVKILCTGDLSKFVWIPLKSEETLLLTHCHLVAGGWESSWVLSIGRAVHDRTILVGRVFSPHSPHKGLWLPHNQGQVNYQSFEILAYGCEISNLKNFTLLVN